ncbi:GspH/FimT family pseudopilin [Thioalkalicoccus limnaeus]|uniref:Type II secretion system protein H n=1 Tax=Thioalkalicoccus limnaeus TaxID=120681 RepID=A0ABV4BHX0_9GAMM
MSIVTATRDPAGAAGRARRLMTGSFRTRYRVRGFTLLELMITVALVAILTTLGVPSFREAMQNNRAATQTNDLLAALSLARSEAVRRGAIVSVCPSTDQATCADATDWSTGWILFVDGTNPLEVVRVWPALAGIESFTGPKLVSFRGSGEAVASGSFSHKIKNCSGNQARTITVSPTGHARAEKTACTNGS